MIAPFLLPTFLNLHIMALVTMAGITLADYFSYLSLWKYFEQKDRLQALLNLMTRFRRVSGIGAATLILTGFGMMAVTHGVFGEQLWFRIKFALVILLVINALVVGLRQATKLRKLMQEPDAQFLEQARGIKTSLSRFHYVQLSLFVIIIVLSIFKFN
jgi:hypothetical protein